MARRGTRSTVGIGAGLLAVGLLVGCSGSDAKPESNRKCAVVQADELSDITGVRLKLIPADEDPRVCRYRGSNNPTEVDLTVTSPVEANSLKLLLTTPTRERGISDEAWSSDVDTALGYRLLARERGAMLTVDLGLDGASSTTARKAARRIAKSGVANLPDVAPKKPTGPRGTKACERFETTKVAEALGGKPEVSATMPPGSCLLTVPDKGLNVTVSVLAELANEQMLGTIIKSAPDPKLTSVSGMPGYWIATPGAADAGGQLDFLDDGTLRQVSVIGTGFTGTEAQELATTIATLGFAS